MSWVFSALLLCAGLIALAPVVVARKPQSRTFFTRLARADAVIGIVLLVAGLLAVFRYGIAFVRVLGSAPFVSLMGLATIATAIALGFLLGQRWITPFLRTPRARTKTEAMATGLLRWQVRSAAPRWCSRSTGWWSSRSGGERAPWGPVRSGSHAPAIHRFWATARPLA